MINCLREANLACIPFRHDNYYDRIILQIFNEIDADGSGYITPDEVVIGFKKMGVILSLNDAKAIVSEADTNMDGRISYTGDYS